MYCLPCTYYLGGVHRSAIGVFACQMLPFKCIQLCTGMGFALLLKQLFFFFFLNVEVHPGFGASSFCQKHQLL